MLTSPTLWNAGGKGHLTASPPPIQGQACNKSGERCVTARCRNPITMFVQTITACTKITALFVNYTAACLRGEKVRAVGGWPEPPPSWTWPVMGAQAQQAWTQTSIQLHPGASLVWTPLPWVTETPHPTRNLLDSLSLQYVGCYLFIYQQKQRQLREPLTCACHVQSPLWQENLLNMRCYQSLSTSVLPGKSPVGPKLVERNSETRPNCSSAYTEAVGAACPYFLRNQRDTSVSCTIWHAVHSKIHTTRAVHSYYPHSPFILPVQSSLFSHSVMSNSLLSSAVSWNQQPVKNQSLPVLFGWHLLLSSSQSHMSWTYSWLCWSVFKNLCCGVASLAS